MAKATQSIFRGDLLLTLINHCLATLSPWRQWKTQGFLQSIPDTFSLLGTYGDTIYMAKHFV
ncbi:MAG: hypothetical protein IID41_08905 [Planctomycetes bacterium]|nr:hypothetical protein [Planctomycetota bacterium]